METRFLETFVLVARLGSMAEASRRLGITAATIAQRVDALEKEIGTPLILRSGRTVRPTDAGYTILQRADSILRECANLKTLAAMDTVKGEFRLGAISTALTGILPNAMVSLSAHYPQIELYVVPGTSKALYEMQLREELDAIVIVQPPFDLPKTCLWRPLRADPLVVIAPRGIRIKTPDKLLASEPLIRYDRSHWGGQLADRYLRSRSIKVHDRFELDALEAIAVLVDRGLGVSILPDWPPPWPEGLKLQKIAVDAPSLVRWVGILWLRSTRRIRLIDALLASLKMSRLA
jgi:DNA-binding transcriptional LysR family regulator